ncbi:hypothetical protein Taro_029099 [Colocasia esculenta]|uniref:Uncharacterized protein n=1 Tax=Colocasia esculenta TaxID=4460 RepID=A0A843VW75_COLES|nr:hypothetical protein [Colocasia esculenta]
MECRGGACSGFSSSNNISPFDCILFDLDDTLYSGDTGIVGFVRQNIEEFLVKTCGVTAEKACSLRSELFGSHGSSLTGLRATGYDVHPDDYHSYVHGRLPYELIQPDPLLRDLLQSIPQTKIIFTNSDREHARKVLTRLGLDGCFDGVICFEALNPDVSAAPILLKPSPLAFEAAIRLAGIDPRRTLFLDDSERNIAAGKALGLRTALVGKPAKTQEADYLVGSVHDLHRTVPDVWRGAEGKKPPTRPGEEQKLRLSVATAPVEA